MDDFLISTPDMIASKLAEESSFEERQTWYKTWSEIFYLPETNDPTILDNYGFDTVC